LISPITIHRKDWEYAMGIIAMKRFNKLNMNSLVVGIGSGFSIFLYKSFLVIQVMIA